MVGRLLSFWRLKVSLMPEAGWIWYLLHVQPILIPTTSAAIMYRIGRHAMGFWTSDTVIYVCIRSNIGVYMATDTIVFLEPRLKILCAGKDLSFFSLPIVSFHFKWTPCILMVVKNNSLVISAKRKRTYLSSFFSFSFFGTKDPIRIYRRNIS